MIIPEVQIIWSYSYVSIAFESPFIRDVSQSVQSLRNFLCVDAPRRYRYRQANSYEMPIRISDTSETVDCIYDTRWKERKVPAWVREGERTRERGLNTDSTIPGRLAFHRQSGPSTTDRKVRVFPPSRLHISLLTPASLPRRYYARSSSADCWSRLYRFPSFATAWLAPRLFLRLVERSPPAIRILSPSSSHRAPAIDIASIESDVEGALSGSSRRPEYPAATSSVPPLLGETPEMTPMRGSLSNVDTKQSFGSARFSCLQIDPESLICS